MGDFWLSLSVAGVHLLLTWAILERLIRRSRFRREIERVRQIVMIRRAEVLGLQFSIGVKGRRAAAPVAAIARLSARLRAPPGLGDLPDPETLALIALEVSSRLRSGADLQSAWAKTWERLGSGDFQGLGVGGEPLNLVEKTLAVGAVGLWSQRRWKRSMRRRISRGAASALVIACRFSFLAGAPLAEVLREVARGIAVSTRVRRAQERAFVGPQLSARILTALPVAAVAGGEWLGADAIAWFLAGGMGSFCALAGVLLIVIGYSVSGRMIAAARKRAADRTEATVLSDLARSGLSAGASIPTVLTALGQASKEPDLQRIARELLMGAPWRDAWEPLPRRCDLLERGLQPGWEQGVSPLELLAYASEQARETQLATAEEEAGRLAVKLVIPLGLCLLPAFIVLGIVPVVVTLLRAGVGI